MDEREIIAMREVVIMSFKKFRSVPLPYNKQALIRYTCLDYACQPSEIQRKIDALCVHIAKFNSRALFVVMTTEKPLNRIAREFYISRSQLFRYRKRFYSEWYTFNKY